MQTKFYRCNHCKKIVEVINESDFPLTCCNEQMKEIIPCSQDAAKEKHVPSVTKNGNIIEVTVGSVEHPMTEEHYIQWIFIQSKKGFQRKQLTPAEKPYAVFALTADDELENVYAYCNLHGLWKC